MPATADSAGGAPRSPELVLFVCRANVCRSPALEFLAGKAVRDRGHGSVWEFASAGTVATPGLEMCASSAAAIADHEGSADFVDQHRSRSVSEALISDASLILTASQAERAALVRPRPDARRHSFTMVEAALLMESARARGLEDRPHDLAELVAAMHESRGTISPPERPALLERVRRRQHTPHSFDIDDAHVGAVRTHRPVLDDIRWTSRHVVEALVAIAPRG